MCGPSFRDSAYRFSKWSVLHAAALGLLMGLATGRVSGVETSWNLPGSGAWDDPASWTDGIPAAGDTAVVGTLPSADAVIQVDGPASVGALEIANEHELTFAGSTLQFDTTTAGTDATLTIAPPSSHVTFETPFTLQALLVIDTGQSTVLDINGGFGSGDQSVTKNGAGEMSLAGDSGLWSGELLINAGMVRVKDSNGLGNELAGTTLDGGVLSLEVVTAEPLLVHSGEIRFAATGIHPNAIDIVTGSLHGTDTSLGGTITLAGGTATIKGENLGIRGSVQGSGDLTLVGHSATSPVRLYAPLTHEGITSLSGNLNVMSTGDIFQQRLRIEQGTLNIDTMGEVPVSADIVVLRSGTIKSAGAPLAIHDLRIKSGEISAPLAGASTVTKTTESSVSLTGDNSYTGQTIIDKGTILVGHTNALGSHSDTDADATIVNAAGTLSYVARHSSNRYATEKIILNGGTLETEPVFEGQRRTILANNIELTADSVIRSGARHAMTIEGSIRGTGGIRFVPADDPQPYPAATEIKGVASYSGETVVATGAVARFRKPLEVEGGLRVKRNGLLSLGGGGGGGQSIDVRQGKVVLTTSPVPYNYNIVLRGGQLTGSYFGDTDTPELATDLVLDHGAILGDGGNKRLIVSGAVHGSGSLLITDNTVLRGQVANQGDVIMNNGGSWTGAGISGPLRQSGDILITGGRLVISGRIGPVVPDVLLAGSSGASVAIGRSNVVGTLVLDGRDAERSGWHDRFAVRVSKGRALTIRDDLRVLSGVVEGRIEGQTALTKRSTGEAWLRGIGESSFETIVVQDGLLNISGTLGPNMSEVRLEPSRTARLVFEDVGTYEGRIVLNDRTGNGSNAALVTAGNTLLSGDIYLDESGSSIGQADLGGSIHGGTLYKVDDSHELVIRGGNHTYGGETRMIAGQIVLVDQGVLNSTSQIVGAELAGATNRSTRGAELVLDNRGSTAIADRIPDATPLIFAGNRLTLIGREAESVSETVGRVTVGVGASEFVVQNGVAPDSRTTLVINQLQRDQGATAKFAIDQPGGAIRFATPPVLDDNLLGGWAVFRKTDFATYGPDGVAAYGDLHAYATDLSTATAADNVAISDTPQEIFSDRNINALRTRRGSQIIDLNGHRLNIESGGLLLGRDGLVISGGVLTAGGDSDGELIINTPNAGRLDVNAEIADNPGGSVGVTVSGRDGGLRLGKSNSYTGATTASDSRLYVATAGALPAGTDLTLSGSRMLVEFDGTEPLRLGAVTLARNSSIEDTNGNAPPLDAESYVFASGFVDVEIVGEGLMTKTQLGKVTLMSPNPNFSGPIIVEQGELYAFSSSLGQGPLDDDHAVIVRRDGQLVAGLVEGRKIVLEGGSFQGGTSGPIEVRLPSLLRGVGGNNAPKMTGPLTGTAELTLDNVKLKTDNLNTFAGNLRVADGGALIAGNNSDYEGDIVVTGTLTASGSSALGSGLVTIMPDGMLRVEGTVDANVHMAAGGIFFDAPSGTLAGPVQVTGKSSIGFYQSKGFISGPLRLDDASELKLRHDRMVDFVYLGKPLSELHVTGDVLVGGSTTITAYDNDVILTGWINAAVPDASLDLVGPDMIDVQASLHAGEGQTLTITNNGLPGAVTISDLGKRAGGRGTLRTDILVTDGAAVAPGESTGQSVGLLTIDGDVTFAETGRFAVELAGTVRGEQYDALDVAGQATLDGTLDVDLLGGYVPARGTEFTVMSASGIEGVFTNALRSVAAGDWVMEVAYGDTAVLLRSAGRLGDVNGDGEVNGLDVDPFVSTLLSGTYDPVADMNFDATVDGLDVDPFVDAVAAGGVMAGIPEPATMLLLILGTLGAALVQGRTLYVAGDQQ